MLSFLGASLSFLEASFSFDEAPADEPDSASAFLSTAVTLSEKVVAGLDSDRAVFCLRSAGALLARGFSLATSPVGCALTGTSACLLTATSDASRCCRQARNAKAPTITSAKNGIA